MDDLLEALRIFRKYGDNPFPFQCEHDTLIVNYDPAEFSAADRRRLDELGFSVFEGEDWFTSFRFGSA
jgi:hypothetical protein